MTSFIRQLRTMPITWLLMLVCIGVWGATHLISWRLRVPLTAVQHWLGAANTLRLWDGAWWTIFTTAFHHGGWLHLVCNVSFLWWYGGLLEERLGSGRYLVFSLMGLFIAGVSETFLGPYVGISGMLCAHLGLIWAWRPRDPWLQEKVPAEQLRAILNWIWLCIPISWFGWLNVGNTAHISGLIYGYLAGTVYFGSDRARIWRPVFLVAHTFFVVATCLLVYPVWNGEYHWHRALKTADPDARENSLRLAVNRNPRLEQAWVMLAQQAEQQRRYQTAWELCLTGLRHVPASKSLATLARRIWVELPDQEDRQRALYLLRLAFGSDAPDWETRLTVEEELVRFELPPARPRPIAELLNGQEFDSVREPDVQFELPRRALDEIPRAPGKLPPPDPDAPGSAEEGRAA